MKDKVKKIKCFGCGACMQICPKQCIKMLRNEQGFLYPKIDMDICVKCNLCQKVCPSLIDIAYKGKDPICLVAEAKDENILMNSSSGGAFTTIVNIFCKENYSIFGAAYDKELNLYHTNVYDKDLIEIFRKSKYLQSDTGQTYKKVKELISNNMNVLYTGTPCQIAGLNTFLQKKYDNLLTIDLLCTGIASPKFYKDTVEFLENKYCSKIEKYDMRNKVKMNGQWNIMNSNIVFRNGLVISNKDSNMFKGCYSHHIGYRNSCYHCKFANQRRTGDITIGDWWKDNKLPSNGEYKGASIIMLNSDKAKNIRYLIDNYMVTMVTNLEELKQQQLALINPVVESERNISFWDDFSNKKVEYVLRKYSRLPRLVEIARVVGKIFPKKFRIYMKKILLK